MSADAPGVAHIDWRGPRPIEYGRLVGRNKARQDLLDACRSNLVVVITAASGVGKTSFINDAIPYLESNDLVVKRADPWDRTLTRFDKLVAEGHAEPSDTAALYSVALGATKPEGTIREPAAMLKDDANREVIVVFDQTEELLRYRRALGAKFLDLVSATARSSGATHIVIARSEFADQMRPLERHAVPWPLRLQEITDRKTIMEIIARPAAFAEVELDRAAVRRIHGWWEAARRAPEHSAQGGGVMREAIFDVGLLHLQALLWSFKQWALGHEHIGPDGRSLTDDDLLTFARAALPGQERDPADPAAGAQLIEGAILRYVRDTIDAHTAADVVSQLDPPIAWSTGPRLMLARVAPFFSSAGYKIPQALSSLIPAALAEELSAAKQRDLRVLARRRVSRESITEEFPLRPAGIALDWITDHPDSKGSEHDWVTLEMINSLEAGLKVLASSEVNILRRFAPGEADPIYDLVHDGLGGALNAWAESALDSPHAVIGVIAARDGLEMLHSLRSTQFPDATRVDASDWGAVTTRDAADASTTDPPVAVLSGLRWVGALIGTKDLGLALEDLVFEGCELTGAVFIDVHLHNVTFSNCKLGGVAMIGCTLDGVTFIEGTDGQLDTLSIEEPRPGAKVEFNTVDTRGLFLTGLDGGTWTFAGKRLQHLVVTANETQLTLHFTVEELRHVTVEAKHWAMITAAHPADHVTTDPERLFPADAG